MKTCFKCQRSLSESEFYAHPCMRDKLLGKCKGCTKADAMANRNKQIESVRAYDRTRASLPHRRENAHKQVAKERRAHPERNRVRLMAQRLLPNQPSVCQGCDRDGLKLERHHSDYSKPLLVLWLCKPCHAIADKERRMKESA